MYSTIATRAAAPPPTPLKSATSCGIAVIWTLRAAGTPMITPTIIAPIIQAKFFPSFSDLKKTRSVAIAAPAAPSRFPRRAVLGWERPLSERMKQTPASKPIKS